MKKLILQKGLLFVFTILVISTINANAAEELLKVDKTLIIQIVIFIAAIFILNSLLFKPLLQLVERREQLTTGRIKEAKELERKVEQIIKEYKEKLDEVSAKAHSETQALLEEAKAKLELEAREIRAKIKPEIEILARNMASQVLGREL